MNIARHLSDPLAAPLAAPLADFQADFWRALWSPADPATSCEASPGPWSQPGFAVYRNTVLTACADALISLYPAVHRLTGDAWMRATALDFARASPPTGGDLQHHGGDFPDFLAARQLSGTLSADLAWLVDVARLDRLWSESHVAADAPVLDVTRLMRLAPERLAGLRLTPHPAARWRWSGEWPAFSLWQAARTEGADPNPPHWHGQGALMTRPEGAVLATEIDAAACALLDACRQGVPLADALDAVQAAFPTTDPGAALGLLLQRGAFASWSDLLTEHSP